MTGFSTQNSPENQDAATEREECSICHQTLRDGEELVAIWYAPCAWYVLYHVEAERVAAFHEALSQGKPAVEFSCCGEAGFQVSRGD